MQLFDHKAVGAAAGAADVLAQRQAGDHGTGGQSRQLVGQCLGGCVIQRIIHGSTLQQKLRLGVVGQDQVGRPAQLPDAADEFRGHGGIGLAVVAHHGVHHLVGRRPQSKGFFGQCHLRFAAQVAGINAVKIQAQCMIMLQSGLAVGTAVQTGRGAQPAGMGGKHHRGQSHRLQPHDRQHRQDHRQTAAAHAGQIMDAEDLFGFNRFYQIRNLLTLYGSNAGRMPPKGRTA